jgi:uncharacterized ParB-like nuclease family protein
MEDSMADDPGGSTGQPSDTLEATPLGVFEVSIADLIVDEETQIRIKPRSYVRKANKRSGMTASDFRKEQAAEEEKAKAREAAKTATERAHVRTLKAILEAWDEANSGLAGDVARGFLDPIEVDKITKGSHTVYHLVDGFHRVAAAKAAGKRYIPATVFADRGHAVRQARAGMANSVQKKRLTNAEKKRTLYRIITKKLHRWEGPRGGRANRPFRMSAELRVEIGGVDRRTFWKWVKDRYPALHDAWRKAESGEWQDDLEEQDEFTPDPEYLEQQRTMRQIEEAITLARNLMRTLTGYQDHRAAVGLAKRLAKEEFGANTD